MPNTPATAETLVRQFAQQHPTANVLQALAYCEAGTLSWEAVAGLFERSLGKALAEVTR